MMDLRVLFLLCALSACGAPQSPEEGASEVLSSDYADRKIVFDRVMGDTMGVRPGADPQKTYVCVKNKLAAEELDPGVVFAAIDAFYDVVDNPEELSGEQRRNMANAVVLAQKYTRQCASTVGPSKSTER